jgi:serine/threonine protein kinase
MGSLGDFDFSHLPAAGGTIVRLGGTIDEKFNSALVFSGLSDAVVFDLKNVKRITSFGVREWVRGLGGLKDSTYFFLKCRPSILAQFNMVPNFGGTGFVLSFFAPYRCPSCGEETEKLIDVRAQFDLLKAAQIPPERCPKCTAAMELDDNPDVYFAYFASAQAPRLSPPLAALVDQATNEITGSGLTPTRGGMKAIKQVDDVVTGIWLSGRLDENASVKRALADLEGDVVFVLSGIDTCTPGGISRLAQFTVAPDKEVRFSFARVPPIAFGPLQVLPKELQRAPIVSVEIIFKCATCRTAVQQEVDVGDLKKLSHAVKLEQPYGLCSSCGDPLVPALDLPTLSGLVKTHLSIPSQEIRQFLDNHRSPPSATPAVGGIIATTTPQRFGSYEIIRPLGAGGMAEIFLARLRGPSGFVKTQVLKTISRGLATNEQFLQMFLDEARLAARISHPNVVQIFELAEVSGQYFIAMEHVPGWNLNSVLAAAQTRNLPMPIEVACRIISDTCGGLAAAHSLTDEEGQPLGVVHRDVTPSNVLISPQGAVKLTDFGIAKAIDQVEKTQPGVLKGKVPYLSPEAIEGTEVDARSDIFAAGVLLYECLTTRKLFRRTSDIETMEAVRQCLVPPVSRVRPDVPELLEAVTLRALARDREDRYGTASQMQRALDHFLVTLGLPATSAEVARYLKTLMQPGGTPSPDLVEELRAETKPTRIS